MPVIILSETEKINEVLVEVKKNEGDFIKGKSYLINVELLEKTQENIWKSL